MTDNDLLPIELNEDNIKDMIYEIRGQKVMLDFDLARIYGYETKYLNRQVKRNIERFPSDFMFQITIDEFKENLMCQNVTSSWGGTRKRPYAFTEQGIYALMTVLGGELAVAQTIALIRTFKAMRDYLISTKQFISIDSYEKLIGEVKRNSKDIKIIKQKYLIDPRTFKKYLIMDGNRIEGSLAYESIFKLAKKTLYIVDDYVSRKTLQLLKVCNPKVAIVLFTMNKTKELSIEDIDDFIKDTNMNIELKKNSDIFHGRFIFIDYGTKNYRVFRCGPSVKDAGNKIDTIDEEENKDLYNQLIGKLINEN